MRTIREDYAAQVQLQLDAFNASVDGLEARLQAAKAEVRASYRAELSELRYQSELVTTQLAQISSNGEASWDAMVRDMDTVRDAFRQSLRYFESQL
jgi:hypothetical protein